MRVVLTIVEDASVNIDNQVVGHIDHGYLLLVGFEEGDNEKIIEKVVDKILSLRIFPDENAMTNLSLDDTGGKILSVSQFTLYADIKKGRRPSFIKALKPEYSKPLYEYFNAYIKEKGYHVETGVFGADMKVKSTNVGPFTLTIDSKEIL